MADRTRTWPHYREVAQKHFDALQMIYDKLTSTCRSCSIYDVQYQNALLCDAFYISGYIFECAAVFTVFYHLGWKKDIEIPIAHTDTDYNKLISANNYKRGRLPDSSYISNWSRFHKNLCGHRFVNYVDTNSTSKSDPFFDGNFRFLPLIRLWNPDKRYYCITDYRRPITISDIGTILNYCQNHIMNIINSIIV